MGYAGYVPAKLAPDKPTDLQAALWQASFGTDNHCAPVCHPFYLLNTWSATSGAGHLLHRLTHQLVRRYLR